MATQQKPAEESEAAQVEDRIRALRARIDPMIASDGKSDGADATMSAIEQALNLSPQDLRSDAEPRRNDSLRLPKVDDPQDFTKRPSDAGADLGRRRVEPDAPPLSPNARAANDDRRSVGQILQALQYRPSRTPMFLASGLSAGWLGMVGVYTMGARTAALDHASIALLILAAFGPVAFFFVIAMLSQRLQEMRHTARSMGEVVIRLADPDSYTSEQVMILSQAIRREIASMGDGVERALARAGELELMVHSEVSNLERSYAENERRMRALIDELSSEREAIVTNADRVRQSVVGVQEVISREVAHAGSRIAEQVNEAGLHVNALLSGHAEDIAQQLRGAGDELVATLGNQGDSFIQKLTETGEAVTNRLFDSTKLFDSTINQRAESVENQLQASADAIGERIDAAATRIADTISERGAGLISRFAETSESINASVLIQGQELASTLTSSGERISAILSERTGNAQAIFETSTQALIDHNKHLEALFDARNRELEDLTERARTDFASTLTLSCDNISAMISERTNSAAQIFDGSAQALSDHNRHLEELFVARTRELEELTSRARTDLTMTSGEIESALADNVKKVSDIFLISRDQLTETSNNVSSLLEARVNAFNETVRVTGDDLATANAALQSALDEHRKTIAETAADARATIAAAGSEVAGEMDARTQAFSKAIVGSRDEVLNAAAHVESAIAHRTVALREILNDSQAAIIQTSDSLVASLAEKTGEVCATFESARQSMTEVSDGSVLALSERIETLRNALNESSDSSVNLFAERTDALRLTLTEVSDYAARSFAERSEALRSSLSDASDDAARTFTERADALRLSMGESSEDVTRIFTERAEALRESMLASQQSVAQTSEQIAASIAEHTEASRSALLDQQAQLNTAGEMLIASLLENITAVREALHDSRGGFIEAGDEVAATIGSRIEAVHAAIQSSSRELAESAEQIARLVESQTDLARTTLSSTGQDLLDISARVTTELSGHVASTREEIEAVHLEMNHQLEAHRQFLSEALGEHAGAAGANFADATNEVISAMAVHSERVAESLSARFVDFKTGVVSLGDVLADQLAAQSDRFSGDVNEKLATLEETFTTHGAAFNDRIGERTREASALFDKQVDEFERRTTSRTEKVSSTLQALVQRIETGLDGKIEDFEQRASIRTQDAASSIQTLVERIETGLDGKIEDFEQRTTLRTQDAANSIQTLVERIETGLDGKIEDFEQRTTIRTQDVTTSLESLVQRIETGLDIRSRNFSESLATNALDIARSLGGGLQEIKGMLDPTALEEVLANKIKDLGATLATRIEELQKAVEEGAGSIDDRSAQITKAITEHARLIHETLESASRIVNDNMGARASELHTLLDNTARNMTETLSSVSTTGVELSSEVVKLGEIVTNTIETRASAIVGHLTEKQHQFTNAISATSNGLLEVAEVTSQTLRDAIEQSASNSAHSLMTLGAKIESEFSSTLAKLETTGDSLHRLISVTDSNLSNIDGSLSESVMKLQTALGSVSFQINTLNHTASNTVTGIEQLGEHIRGHNAELGQTLADLSRTQRELEDRLEERRRTMYELLSNVDQKTNDIDNIMKAFNSLIEGSFLDAERRAREIGELLSRSSEDVVETLSEKFALVRDETSKEREVTLVSMREAYDSASSEVQQLFGQALERFRDSAEEMRGVAQKIHHEINLAREEVQRGAADLPRESAEQAAAMRRVVTEQIKALSDLTEVVQRSGRNLDLAEPAAMPQMRAEAPRIEPQRSLDKPRMPRVEAPTPVAPSLSDDQPRARPAVAAPQRSATNDRGPGWISDLLARASQDDGDAAPAALKSPARAVQSLDMISHDISRMVDHAAVVDAWDRYYRNERRAFSRRIYKGQGQQTFEEIRRRYGADPEFRETVDRYTQEFERVLTDVARDDRDGNLSRSYLISDQGKVYTMLAHAAGRID